MSDFPSMSSIIPGLKRGEEEAWNDLCNRFRQALEGKARGLLRNSKLKKRISAEDLAQETLLRAWKAHKNIASMTTGQFAKLVLTIMRNLFIDSCRPANAEQSTQASWFDPTGDGDSPSEALIAMEDEIRLHASIAELPEKYREVLVLRYFDGLKLREIGERLGMTTNKVAGINREGLVALIRLYKPS